MKRYSNIELTGSLKLAPRIVDNVSGSSGDSTNRITVQSYQQSSQTEPFGDVFRPLAENGGAKPGIKWYRRGQPAQVTTTNTSPYAITTGQTLLLKINGGPTKTVTFSSITSGAATADQVSLAIVTALNTGTADAYLGAAYTDTIQTGSTVNEDTLTVTIASLTYGTGSTVEIVSGTALTGLGLTATTYTGSVGLTNLGTLDGLATALAWIVAHDFPNNVLSNNKHRHISIEVPDASGEMQTRIAISYWKNVAEILVSSACLILDTYPLTLASSANSNKDLDFSRDNTGRKIARVNQWRTEADSSGGNMVLNQFSDAGVAFKIISFNRLLKYVAFFGAIQESIRSSANSSASVMTLSPQNGNVYKLSGTATVNYIANTDWQAGSQITVILQGAATLTHAAGSPTGTNRPFKLLGSVSYTAGASGSSHTFMYDGSGYENSWIEIARTVYDASGTMSAPVEVTGTTQAMTAGVRYIANNAGLVTLTLPATAAKGDQFTIRGKGAGLWKLAQNASQTVHGATDTTTGTGGSLTATARYDCVTVECITANTDFVIINKQGTLTVV